MSSDIDTMTEEQSKLVFEVCKEVVGLSLKQEFKTFEHEWDVYWVDSEGESVGKLYPLTDENHLKKVLDRMEDLGFGVRTCRNKVSRWVGVFGLDGHYYADARCKKREEFSQTILSCCLKAFRKEKELRDGD